MTTLVLSFYNRSCSFLQIRRTTIKAWISLNSVKIPSPIMKLTSLEHHKKSALTYNGRSVVTTLAPLFFNGSSSFIGNKDFHKSLNEFDFPPQPSTSYRLSCP